MGCEPETLVGRPSTGPVALRARIRSCRLPARPAPEPDREEHRAKLELFAESLGSTDQVALESTGPAMEIARIIEPHVAGWPSPTPQDVRAISRARVKSDRFDARTLARLLAADMLAPVWVPDPATQACAERSCGPRRGLDFHP